MALAAVRSASALTAHGRLLSGDTSPRATTARSPLPTSLPKQSCVRLPTRADYREKIWDHAAGKFVVEQAGGVVTDVTGAALDFSRGATLDANSGVVATDGRFHEQVIDAVGRILD